MKDRYNLTLSKKNPIVTDELLLDKKLFKKVTISKYIKKLPLGAFFQAKELAKVYFEPDSQLAKLPVSCFDGCIRLSKINALPTELISIEAYAFRGCIHLNEIYIAHSVSYVDETAFDHWRADQTIYLEKEIKLSQKCKAKVVVSSQDDPKESLLNPNQNGDRRYIVTAKCGHVGRNYYMPIDFPVISKSKKEAASIVKRIPRVKRDHIDAILSIVEVDKETFDHQIKMNHEDPYLCVTSKYQQKALEDDIDKRKVLEPRYVQKVNKKTPITYKKEGKSIRYCKELEKQVIKTLDEDAKNI